VWRNLSVRGVREASKVANICGVKDGYGYSFGRFGRMFVTGRENKGRRIERNLRDLRGDVREGISLGIRLGWSGRHAYSLGYFSQSG
jgi:hypothetical protein